MSELIKKVDEKIKFLHEKKKQHLRYSVIMISVKDIEELINLLNEIKGNSNG